MATFNERLGKYGARVTAQIRIQRKGKKHTESKTFSTEKAAKKWAKKREVELDDSKEFDSATFQGKTLKELISRYIEKVGGKKGFERTKQSHLNFLKTQDIAEEDVRDIDASMIVDHLQKRSEKAAPSTVMNDFVYIGVVLRHARVAWKVPFDLDILEEARTTAKNANYIARSGKRKRRPTADELRKLFAYFEKKDKRSSYPMVLIIWLVIYSGRRTAELCRIKRSEINREEKLYWVRDVKHPREKEGNDKQAKMPDKGWEVLDRILEEVPEKDDRLLPLNPKTIGSKFTDACKFLGIENLHFYDLKHEALSRLAEDGYTIPQITEVSLHDDWGSLAIYVNLNPQKTDRLEYEP
ncbi:MAG: tyrosine-type recombinase/integrase [Candidatus Thiodiazotropha sp.]